MDEVEEQHGRCRRLQHAILKRAFDDLRDLLNHTPIQHGDEDRPLNRAERAALLNDTVDFFLGPCRSTCSLDALCDSLDLDAERIRARARQWVIAGEVGSVLSRRRVTPSETAEILSRLAAGESSTRLGARFGLDPATVRKVRIRARKGSQVSGPAADRLWVEPIEGVDNQRAANSI